MDAIPPGYNASDSPPSYDEVIKRIDHLVGSDRTPKKYLDVVKGLSNVEINAVAKSAGQHPLVLSDNEKQKFTVGAAKTMSSPDAVPHLKEAANKATDAAAHIRNIFDLLSVKIQEIDKIHASGFSPTLNDRRSEFEKILLKSRVLAVEIAVYGKKFDKLIVKFCADKQISVQERKDRIDTYIEEAKQYEEKSTDIQNDFTKLKTHFGTLVADFATWAKDKEGQLTKEICDINEEIKKLEQEVANLKSILLKLGIGVGVGLPVLAVAAALSGPFAPFVAIGGLIALGATAAAIAGLAIAISEKDKEIARKRDNVHKKEEQREVIRSSRQALSKLGHDDILPFSDHVSTLSGYWESTASDALAIQVWLKGGADDANRPTYMKINLDEAVEAYASMATYLQEYARGIHSVSG